jgi:hypothetical protein
LVSLLLTIFSVLYYGIALSDGVYNLPDFDDFIDAKFLRA